MNTFVCLRCDFTWQSEKTRPSRCKGCDSKVWDTPKQKADAQKKFAELIKVETDECIVWPLSVLHDGYGRIRVGKKTLQTHRHAYEQRVGPIPDGMKVCHHCDNPPCMNYRHFFIGTVRDNNDDKRKKLRHPFGESHPNAKFTDEIIREIRSKYVFDLKNRAQRQLMLAEEYGTKQSTISAIISRKIWKHVK